MYDKYLLNVLYYENTSRIRIDFCGKFISLRRVG